AGIGLSPKIAAAACPSRPPSVPCGFRVPRRLPGPDRGGPSPRSAQHRFPGDFMRALSKLGLVTVATLGAWGCQAEGEASSANTDAASLNPMISLHEDGSPVFGLYVPPAAPRRGRDAPPPDP